VKHLILFENFKTTSNKKKNLDWLKSFIDEEKSEYTEYTLSKKSKNGTDYLCLKGGDDYEIQFYDNEQDNNFFLVKIIKAGKVIQDFEKNDESEGISPDEIPSEQASMLINRHFKKK
jgi:hypothetical protein